MLNIIKILHTFIWFMMALATLYILYAGITNIFTTTLFVSIALLTIESLVLAYNKWTCPLTPLTAKYTTERKDNFDIYLPLWLARYNKVLFGSLFVVGVLLVLHNWILLL